MDSGVTTHVEHTIKGQTFVLVSIKEETTKLIHTGYESLQITPTYGNTFE